MNQNTDTASFALLAGEAGFDPIADRLRANIRATIEAVFEEELAVLPASLWSRRRRCEGLSPRAPGAAAHRHLWHRDGAGAARPDRG